MGENDFGRDSNNYLGKLRSNFVGTEFQIFDNGSAPKDGSAKDEGEERGGPNSNPRKELAAVMYAANVMGSRGPRKMQAAIPAVDEHDRAVMWRSGQVVCIKKVVCVLALISVLFVCCLVLVSGLRRRRGRADQPHQGP